MTITFSPHNGGMSPTLRDVAVTIKGAPPLTGTAWTSSNPKVELQITAPAVVQTDSSGTATNTMRCTGSNAETTATITVTPQGGTAASATYTFVMFKLTGLFSTEWAQAAFGSVVDPNATPEVITIETAVKSLNGLDAPGAIIRMSANSDNLQFFDPFSSTPDLPLKKSGGHYSVVGDQESGNIELKVGAVAPGIYEVALGPTNYNEITAHLIFIDLYYEAVLQHTGIGKDGQLDLDNFAGNTIPVWIPEHVLSYPQFSDDTPVVLVRVPQDGARQPSLEPIGGIRTVGELIRGAEYSKTLFPDGSYYVYHMVFDAASGFAAQSNLYPVTVTGSSDVEPDTNGTLQAPNILVHGNSIVTQNIVPYLPVGIPKYDGMASGDVVTLDIFIAAWDSSGSNKTAHLPYPQPSILGALQFLIKIPTEDLTNYCADPVTGQNGVIQFQYRVRRAPGGDPVTSRVTKMSINTGPTVP